MTNKKTKRKGSNKSSQFGKESRKAVDRTIINMTVYNFIPMWLLKTGLYGKTGSLVYLYVTADISSFLVFMILL